MIVNLERSLKKNTPRALIEMATGFLAEPVVDTAVITAWSPLAIANKKNLIWTISERLYDLLSHDNQALASRGQRPDVLGELRDRAKAARNSRPSTLRRDFLRGVIQPFVDDLNAETEAYLKGIYRDKYNPISYDHMRWREHVDLDFGLITFPAIVAPELAGIDKDNIFTFLLEIAAHKKSEASGTLISIGRLQELWTGKKNRRNRKHLSQAQRDTTALLDPSYKTGRGLHEWIPCHMMFDVVENASKATSESQSDLDKLLTASHWVAAQFILRSPTQHLIFNPVGDLDAFSFLDHTTKMQEHFDNESIDADLAHPSDSDEVVRVMDNAAAGPGDYALSGHTGALTLHGSNVTARQGQWKSAHNALVKSVLSEGVDTVVDSLKQRLSEFAEATIWSGGDITDLPKPLQERKDSLKYLTHRGAVRTFEAIRLNQKDEFGTHIKEVIENLPQKMNDAQNAMKESK